MSENKYDKYVIEEAKCINYRYYLIKINKEYYLLDYINPADFRNYFIVFFPKVKDEYKVYDIAEEGRQYRTKSLPLFSSEKSGLIVALTLIFFILHAMLFPAQLNLTVLTHDDRIAENWSIVLFAILLGASGIALLLVLLTREKMNVENLKMYTMKRFVKKEETTFKSRFMQITSFVLMYSFYVGVGIAGSNYAGLIVFGIMMPYSVLFSRFTGPPIKSEYNKFKVVKKD